MFLKMDSDVTRCSCHKKLRYDCPKMLAFGLKFVFLSTFSPNASIFSLTFRIVFQLLIDKITKFFQLLIDKND